MSADLQKKRKDYSFWRQFNEKPSALLGCQALADLPLQP